MYCLFIVLYCIVVCVSGWRYSDVRTLDNLQNLEEKDFEQFEHQSK
jgi:hypothetical protein